MIRPLVLILASALGLALCPSCAGPPAPPVKLDVSGVTPAADYRDLAAVLHRALDKDGQIIPFRLRDCSGRLEAQLKLLAVAGPTATPPLFAGDEAKLAYWYNARAAWAMKLALDAHCPEKMASRNLDRRPFPLDGRTVTLEEIDRILLADRDWRTVVAAPCVRLDRAALPKEPFSAADVRARIAQRFNDFLGDSKRFAIDVEGKRLLAPAVLWQFRDRLIESYSRTYGTVRPSFVTALLPYVDGPARRRLQDAIGYESAAARANDAIARVPD